MATFAATFALSEMPEKRRSTTDRWKVPETTQGILLVQIACNSGWVDLFCDQIQLRIAVPGILRETLSLKTQVCRLSYHLPSESVRAQPLGSSWQGSDPTTKRRARARLVRARILRVYHLKMLESYSQNEKIHLKLKQIQFLEASSFLSPEMPVFGCRHSWGIHREYSGAASRLSHSHRRGKGANVGNFGEVHPRSVNVCVCVSTLCQAGIIRLAQQGSRLQRNF